MSPKQQRGEVTVEQVLDTAMRIYASSGEAGLTLGAVTKASKVSSGSIYHHFGSLDGVIAALALRSLDQLLHTLATAVSEAANARSGIQGRCPGLSRLREEPSRGGPHHALRHRRS
ncbi:AcrR family transcriptional regulator [Streptomyces sp. TE33382]